MTMPARFLAQLTLPAVGSVLLLLAASAPAGGCQPAGTEQPGATPATTLLRPVLRVIPTKVTTDPSAMRLTVVGVDAQGRQGDVPRFGVTVAQTGVVTFVAPDMLRCVHSGEASVVVSADAFPSRTETFRCGAGTGVTARLATDGTEVINIIEHPCASTEIVLSDGSCMAQVNEGSADTPPLPPLTNGGSVIPIGGSGAAVTTVPTTSAKQACADQCVAVEVATIEQCGGTACGPAAAGCSACVDAAIGVCSNCAAICQGNPFLANKCAAGKVGSCGETYPCACNACAPPVGAVAACPRGEKCIACMDILARECDSCLGKTLNGGCTKAPFQICTAVLNACDAPKSPAAGPPPVRTPHAPRTP